MTEFFFLLFAAGLLGVVPLGIYLAENVLRVNLVRRLSRPATPRASMTMAKEYSLAQQEAIAAVETYFVERPTLLSTRTPPCLRRSWWQIDEVDRRVGTVQATADWMEDISSYSVWPQNGQGELQKQQITVKVFCTAVKAPGLQTSQWTTSVAYQWLFSADDNFPSSSEIVSFTVSELDCLLAQVGGTGQAAHASLLKARVSTSAAQRRQKAPFADPPPRPVIEVKPPPWPTPQDFNEAIQNPALCFQDSQLMQGRPALSALGLPCPDSGAFGSVYRLKSQEGDYAVKCFLRQVDDQAPRYEQISNYVLSDDLEETVWFEFLAQGIRLHGRWYPILKMEWVEGVSLSRFVGDHIGDRVAMASITQRFRGMVHDLNLAGIAHGDVQHANVMLLPDGQFRLVDYDGMFVPGLSGWHSNELGHRNYQHPARNHTHFGPYLDNFSAWVIDTSLSCLSLDGSLWEKLCAGDECLLFRREDFESPYISGAFLLLANHSCDEIRRRASILRALLSFSPETIPYLSAEVRYLLLSSAGKVENGAPPEILHHAIEVAGQAACQPARLHDQGSLPEIPLKDSSGRAGKQAGDSPEESKGNSSRPEFPDWMIP